MKFTLISMGAFLIFLMWDLVRHLTGKRTFSRQVYRWSTHWRGFMFAVVFVWGYLTCHLAECGNLDGCVEVVNER